MVIMDSNHTAEETNFKALYERQDKLQRQEQHSPQHHWHQNHPKVVVMNERTFLLPIDSSALSLPRQSGRNRMGEHTETPSPVHSTGTNISTNYCQPACSNTATQPRSPPSTYQSIPSKAPFNSQKVEQTAINTTNTSPSASPNSWWHVLIQPSLWNVDAVHFGIRMAVCMTISSLFSLWPGQYPQAMWVLITVLFVCWFPNLDAASVVEKSFQRLYGTFIGASVGLLCGFVSLAILGWRGETPNSNLGTSSVLSGNPKEIVYHTDRQAFFLGCCICIYTYIICWAAVQYKVRGKSIISSYNYACILCLLTFYICLMPFYVDDDDGGGSNGAAIDNKNNNPNRHPHARWNKALFRVMNVLVGCILGAVLSVTVLPRSTVQIIQRKMERQIQLAGQASRAVLWSAAEHFSDNILVNDDDLKNDEKREWSDEAQDGQNSLQNDGSWGFLWRPTTCYRTSLLASERTWRQQSSRLDSRDDGDEALKKQEAAIHESRLITSQLGMLKYDPFHLGTPDRIIQAFSNEVRNTLSRALRIQHTIVLLDGIVRNDPKHDFSERHIQLFVDVGSLIHDMLVSPSEQNTTEADNCKRKEDSYNGLKQKLAQVRGCIVELANVVAQTSHEVPAHEIGKIGVGIIGSRHNLAGMLLDSDEAIGSDMEKGDITGGTSDNKPSDEDDQGRGSPKFVHGSRVCALLFLQLVEHLALRSIRLYQSWKYCEALFQAAQRKQHRSSLKGQLHARFYESRQRRP